MTDRIVTLSSKNQITLPAKYVKQFNLSKNRKLAVRFRGDSIVLKPQAGLEENMREFWDKHNAKQPISNDELKEATRHIVAKRANK